MPEILTRKLLDSCVLCPRQCEVNRNQGEVGYCGELGFETGRQVEKDRMGKEMVPVYLKTIYETGRVFGEMIEA